jgi:hypothetical protein
MKNMKKLRLLPYVFLGKFPSIGVPISQISDREIVVSRLQRLDTPGPSAGQLEVQGDDRKGVSDVRRHERPALVGDSPYAQ